MKLKGLIREVKPAIEKLKEQGFYINNNLVDSLLRDLGEK